jgi:aminoglycoside phosphotransferase (APT) family kinase protein
MKSFNEGIDQISERLIAYLRNEFNDSMIDYDSPLTQLQGGFETYIYRFKLNGVQKELSKPLILRLYPQFYGTRNAIWESTVQNVLAGEGYPVAQAYFTCTDMSILGGAFFIMDFLPGKPMITAPIETIPEVLGKTHAALHGINPEPLIKSLSEQGIDKNTLGLSNRFDWLKDRASKLPWIRDGVDWLIKNRPLEPERLAVCHGDFHPLNILIQDGKITGVLDWPGFLIADPALDIANTIVLTTIPSKHLAYTVEQDFSSVDWKMAAELYLDAYRSQRLLDSTHLDYYRVMRSVNAFIQGFDGQKVWQHPLIVKDLIEFIHKITEILITMPD